MSKFNYLYEFYGFDKNGEVKQVFIAVTLSYNNEEALNIALDTLGKQDFIVRSIHCLMNHLVPHNIEEESSKMFIADVISTCFPNAVFGINAEKARKELEEKLDA